MPKGVEHPLTGGCLLCLFGVKREHRWRKALSTHRKPPHRRAAGGEKKTDAERRGTHAALKVAAILAEVNRTQMPKGVEHPGDASDGLPQADVNRSQMPKGVEHPPHPTPLDVYTW